MHAGARARARSQAILALADLCLDIGHAESAVGFLRHAAGHIMENSPAHLRGCLQLGLAKACVRACVCVCACAFVCVRLCASVCLRVLVCVRACFCVLSVCGTVVVLCCAVHRIFFFTILLCTRC